MHKSVCDFVDCEYLRSTGCIKHSDLNNCEMSKAGIIEDNQIKTDEEVFNDASMIKTFKSLYKYFIRPN